VTATITVLPGLGTAVDDELTLRASSDGMMLEVYDGNPPGPGATPIFTWPMDASVALPIDTLAGDDTVVVELPAGTEGPVNGIQLDAGAGTNRLIVKSGSVRIDSVATGGTLDSSVGDSAQLLTNGLNQNGVALAGGGKVTILPGGTQASVITSLEFLAMLGAAPEQPDAPLPMTNYELLITKDEGQTGLETRAQPTLLDKPAVAPSAVVPSAVVPSTLIPSAVVPSAVVPSAVARSAVARSQHWRSQWHTLDVPAHAAKLAADDLARSVAEDLASRFIYNEADTYVRRAFARRARGAEAVWMDSAWSSQAR
jgi:hypothetical protein